MKIRMRLKYLAERVLQLDGAQLGLLGIQPHTRRRNRMNGTVTAVDDGGFTVQVGQSFGNCPKYIQAREPHHMPGAQGIPQAEHMEQLDDAAVAMVRQADTFFIATAHPQAGQGGHGTRESTLPYCVPPRICLWKSAIRT